MSADNVISMRPLSSIKIPARSSVTLEPNGKHIMAMEPQEGLEEGSHFPITLVFTHNQKTLADVHIVPVGQDIDSQHHSHHHH